MLNRLQGILCAIALGGLLFFYGEQIWRSTECAYAPKDDACHKHSRVQLDNFNERSALLDFVAHDGITFFTFMLAILTGGLVVVSGIQIRFLIRADQTAQKSAEAALKAAKATEESVAVARETAKQQFETTKESVKLARDEFIASHRPRIILREAITG